MISRARAHLRRAGWWLLAGSVATLTVGLVLVVGSAWAAGGWWQARLSWIGPGLDLTVIGLAGTAIALALLDIVEPLGVLRWLAAPPAAIVGFIWGYFLLGPGVGAAGACCTQPDPPPQEILYSVPVLLWVLLASTLLIGLPLTIDALDRRSRRRQAAAPPDGG